MILNRKFASSKYRLTNFRMKKVYILLISALNVYYFFSWLIVFNSFDNQVDRRFHFLEKWLFFDSLNVLDALLLVLTIISLVLIIRKSGLYRFIEITCFIIHIIFLCFVVWSHL